jgi:hypothetical protein
VPNSAIMTLALAAGMNSSLTLRVPHFSPLLREVGNLHHIGALPLHARSLVPLVRARDFGMTSLLENLPTSLELRAIAVWVGHSCPTPLFLFNHHGPGTKTR